MKITIDIDCTPEEARSFLGLPDIAPMQKNLIDAMEARLKANIDAMDPEAMVETWLPATMKGWEQMQRAFMSQLAEATSAYASRSQPGEAGEEPQQQKGPRNPRKKG